jgi:hypothetical protein
MLLLVFITIKLLDFVHRPDLFFCRVGPPPPRLKTETDPVSETLCFLVVEIRTMDKVQKLISNECYTPSSEPFRMYFFWFHCYLLFCFHPCVVVLILDIAPSCPVTAVTAVTDTQQDRRE